MLIFDGERLEDGELHDGCESGVCCDSGAQLVLVDDLTGAAAPELKAEAALDRARLATSKTHGECLAKRSNTPDELGAIHPRRRHERGMATVYAPIAIALPSLS